MKRVDRVAWPLLAGLLLAVVYAPAPGHTRWWATLHNSAHGPIFGVVAVLILRLIDSRQWLPAAPRWRRYAVALLVALTCGVLTEIVQSMIGRDAELGDLVNDALGTIAFLALYAVFDPLSPERRERPALRAGLLIVAVILCGVLAAPLARSTLKYRQRDARFPVIVDFTAGYDRYFVHNERADIGPIAMPAPWSRERSEQAMRVQLLDDPYPGIELFEPVRDWSGYRELVLDLTNPEPSELILWLRIDDARHNQRHEDRFNRELRLPAQARSILRVSMEEIRSGPAARELDLRDIATVIVFRADGQPRGQMYVSRVWLE